MKDFESFDPTRLKCIQKPESMPYEQVFEVMRKAQDANPRVEYTTRHITEQEVMDKLSGGGCFFVALYDGQLVGTMAIHLRKPWHSKWNIQGKYGVIRYLAVLPEYGRNGIASKLTQACIGWARENDVQVILWDTAYNNYGSIATAKKNQFKKVEYRKFKDVNHPTVRQAYWLTNSKHGSIYRYYHFTISFLKVNAKIILKRFGIVRNRGKEKKEGK